MKKLLTTVVSLGLMVGTVSTAFSEQMHAQDAEVQKDIDVFQNYFDKKFSYLIPRDSFSNGSYQFDEDKLKQFEAQMDLPMFKFSLEKGKTLWNTAFENGESYASCFDVKSEKVRTLYPRWNSITKKVDTLEGAINECRTNNGESQLDWEKGDIAFISAYLNDASAGEIIDVIVPAGEADAKKAWNKGKTTFYTKRGHLNQSCANCHVYSAGRRIRSDILSPAVGHVTHFPVWSGAWEEKDGNGYGTIQRRYSKCYKKIGATPAEIQGSEYNNLEYFHTSMSNGLKYVGTEYRQ